MESTQPHHHARPRIKSGVTASWSVTALCALALFALFAADLIFGGPLTRVDPAVSTWLHGRMHPVITSALFLFTHMHSTIGLAIMSALLAVALVALRRPWWIAWMLLTVQGGQLLNVGMKQVFQRTRPHWDEPLVTLATASFPSGHAAGTTVFWGFVCVAAWALPVPHWMKRLLLVVAPSMIVLTALSRVYLGAHYFSDVLAGIAEGVAWVSLTMLVHSRARSS
jgi:membrane-associated phospholipid phosphatase